MTSRSCGRTIVTMWLLALANGSAWAQNFDNLLFHSLTPCRIIDTRHTSGGDHPLASTETRGFNVFGDLSNQGGSNTGCGLPEFDVSGNPQTIAIAVNFAAVNPQGIGNLKGWAGDVLQPIHAAVVNYQALNPNLNIANAVVMAVRTSGTLGGGSDIVINANGAGTEVVADVNGYFSAESPSAGALNLFLGLGAGSPQVTGIADTAIGVFAMPADTGGNNTAVGQGTLFGNTSGSINTAVGTGALANNTEGSNNVAIGGFTMQGNTTGSDNIAINGGNGIVFGSSNIDIADDGLAGDENNTIRIGAHAVQTRTFIAGIDSSNISSGDAVFVDPTSGQLGITSSSLRYKQDVRDMGDVGDTLMHLRPVTFNYKPEYDHGSHLLQYGLVAEEVAKVAPGLVQFDKDGQPQAVRYHFVNAMLLAEVQRLRADAAKRDAKIRELVAHQKRIENQWRAIDKLERQLKHEKALEVRLQQLEERCESPSIANVVQHRYTANR